MGAPPGAGVSTEGDTMLSFEEDGDATTTFLAVSGRLDSQAADSFGAQLNAVLDRGPKRLLLDCLNLTFLSSAGIRELVRAVKRCRAGNTAIAMCCVNDNIYGVLEISGMSKILQLYPSRDAWLAAQGR